MSGTPDRISLAARLRNNFLTGLIICAPVVITSWLIWTFIHWADSWVKPYIPLHYNPEEYFQFAIPGLGLLIAVVFITLIGLLGSNLFGQWVVTFTESILNRTPLVRPIYKGVKQIFETVLKENTQSFRTVGLIEFPGPGTYALVFISAEAKGELAVRFNELGQEMIAVFLPPTPVPTAGFLLFVPREKVIILDMSPEDAAKLLISGGLVNPEVKDRLIGAKDEKDAKP
ncbi:DUF502 domain-containing protein [Rhizobiaceae bacterium BDR2-2]|uniref:DUF502 domain-containing protein n=1 Tax=Ectorhizobium quercum TaxID=2965071 RepID=A0AAE3MZ96_9HYPH|nr:DUF502 domain-containing protein [Ectorhizobium quercum]MCX8997684.1 DUF502 domain-containing protein [Ectorhizobium quercum]